LQGRGLKTEYTTSRGKACRGKDLQGSGKLSKERAAGASWVLPFLPIIVTQKKPFVGRGGPKRKVGAVHVKDIRNEKIHLGGFGQRSHQASTRRENSRKTKSIRKTEE